MARSPWRPDCLNRCSSERRRRRRACVRPVECRRVTTECAPSRARASASLARRVTAQRRSMTETVRGGRIGRARERRHSDGCRPAVSRGLRERLDGSRIWIDRGVIDSTCPRPAASLPRRDVRRSNASATSGRQVLLPVRADKVLPRRVRPRGRAPRARAGSTLPPERAGECWREQVRQRSPLHQEPSMPTYLSPGVYVEEVAAGARPLEGVGTAVAAFVGLAEDGPVQHADPGQQLDPVHRHLRRVRRRARYLAQSVYGYFMNGGGNCYVVRIGQDGTERTGAAQRPGQGAGRRADARRSAGSRSTAIDPAVAARRGQRRGHRPGRRQPGRRHVQAGGQARRRGGRGVRPARPSAGASRTWSTMVNAVSKLDPARGHRQRRRRAAGQRRDRAGRARRRRPPLPSTRLSADDYVGDVAERTGFGGLEAVDEITMLCVPDLMSAYQQGAIDLDTVQAVQTRDDRPLRADGRPDRDPRPAARASTPSRSRSGGSTRRATTRSTPRSTGRGSRP